METKLEDLRSIEIELMKLSHIIEDERRAVRRRYGYSRSEDKSLVTKIQSISLLLDYVHARTIIAERLVVRPIGLHGQERGE